MKRIVDDTEAAQAIIRNHLPRDLHMRLIQETHEMLEAGAVIEDIIWLILPDGGMADRRQEALAHAEEHQLEMADLLRALPDRVPGKMWVLYMGPEGAFCQRWNSVLTAPKALT